MSKKMVDREIIKEIRKGDFEAFELLFHQYFQPLCNFACNLTGDIYKAEDIVQEVFLKIWEKRNKIEFQSSVQAYLYTAVRNRCINKQKSDFVRQEYLRTHKWEDIELAAQQDIETEEFRKHLYDCIEKLPPRCKAVFKQSRFEYLKQEKIANKMDISIKTVKAQIGKALRYVKDCIEMTYPELNF